MKVRNKKSLLKTKEVNRTNGGDRFWRAPRDDHDGRGLGKTWLSSYDSNRGPTAWPLSCPPVVIATQYIVFSQRSIGSILLPQMPKQRKPTGTMGRCSQTRDLRRRNRPLPRAKSRNPLDPTLVNSNGTTEKRHRYSESQTSFITNKI